jgi:hypothetical protein
MPHQLASSALYQKMYIMTSNLLYCWTLGVGISLVQGLFRHAEVADTTVCHQILAWNDEVVSFRI